MSLASILDSNKDLYESEIVCGTLTASVINATTINGGGGGGGITSVTSSDSSLTVTSQNNGSTMNLTNAGQKWSTFNATSSVNVANHAITNVAELDLGTGDFTCPNNILTITNGSVGHYYDDHFNQPTMSDVAGAGSSAGGYDITDVGNFKCTKYLEIGNGITGSSQIHFCYTDGTTTSDNIQLIGSSGGLGAQYYHNGANPVTTLNVSNAGVLHVSDGTHTGRVYDDTLYPPPSASGSVKTIGYYNANVETQTVATTNTGIAIEWQTADATQTVGTTDIALDTNNASFQNKGTVAHVYNFSGYVNFTNTGSSGSSLAVWGQLNNGASQTNISRICNIDQSIDNDFPSIQFSFNVVLQPNDFVTLTAWTNSGAQILINGLQTPYCARIVVTEF